MAKSLVAWVTGLITPILLTLNSVNHRFPSGPAAIASGKLEAVGVAKSLA